MHAFDITSSSNCQQPKSTNEQILSVKDNTERKGWDPVKRSFWGAKLSRSAKIVIGYLESNAGNFKPSLRTIAKGTDSSINTVRLAIKRLEQGHYIKCFKRRGYTTVYKILKSQKENFLSTGVSDSCVSGSYNHRNSNTKENQSNKCDVVNNPYELVRKKLGLKSSIKSLGFKLAKGFHGSKGYDFKKANTFYSDLIVTYGKKGYEELKRYANSSHKVTKWTTEWQRYLLDNIEAQIAGKMAF
jgi:DNA-binding transcriptional regulator YhcF (GntR family)